MPRHHETGEGEVKDTIINTGTNLPANTPEQADVAVDESSLETKEHRKYIVILHNDDYTTMEFVVDVLRRFFSKSGDEAVQIMLQVHDTGKGICGIYTHEIAETKVAQVHEYAKYNGYPLKCSMEPI